MEYVFEFRTDGTVQGLLNDKVLDTRALGERKVERITIIEHDDASQKFFIKWLKGPYAGRIHDGEIDDIIEDGKYALEEYVLFDTYEAAVAREIECVNELRRRGADFS